MITDKLVYELIKDEGFEKKPYVDTVGKITIGIGYNLTDNGLPEDIIYELLYRCIDQVEKDLDNLIPSWRQLSEDRQRVLANMCFNLGKTRFSKFKRFISAINNFDYVLAAKEMEDSQWFHQVGDRAIRLQQMMLNG